MKRNAFTLMELLTVIVIVIMVASIGFLLIDFILERSKMSSLNISAHSVQKGVTTYVSSNKVSSGVTKYDILKDTEVGTYVALGNDPWGNKYKQVKTYVVKNGLDLEANVFIEVRNKGCYYLIDGDTNIQEYDCDYDPTKNGLYTTIIDKNLEKDWHDNDVSMVVVGKLYVEGLPMRGGASHVCYKLNSGEETCITADKRGKATIKVTNSGINNYNIYSKNSAGYSVDKDQQTTIIKIDKTTPTITFSPNSKTLVCTDSDNKVDTEVIITPDLGPAGGKYRYRWYNNGNSGAWSNYHTNTITTTATSLGRRMLEVEISNNAGVTKKYISGDYNLEGPIMSYDHSPKGIDLPYGGTQELKVTFKCTSGGGNINTCGAKFADIDGSGGTFDYTSSPAISATKTISVKKSDVTGRHYLWMRGTTSRGCSIPTQGIKIDRIFS